MALTDAVDQFGDQVQFHVRSFGLIPLAIRRYPREILRLLALVSFGRGALATIGGTVITVGFLTTFVGIELGIQGYHQLSTIGVESLTGFVSAYVNTRLAALQTAAQAVTDPTLWLASSATSSTDSVVATSDATASVGSTTFSVTRLARTQVTTMTVAGDGTVVSDPGAGITITCAGEGQESVPLDSTNLAWRAAELLADAAGLAPDVWLHIDKRIPVAGGMAGGSADAAGALLACDELWGLDTPRAQLFTVFGSPRTRVEAVENDEFRVHMEGVDIYDPVNNVLLPTGAGKVAAWFLDGDYDGKTFCITQAFFPDKSAWEKIAKALGGR